MNPAIIIGASILIGALLFATPKGKGLSKPSQSKPVKQQPKQKEITEALIDLEQLLGITGLKSAFSAFITIESNWVPSVRSNATSGYKLVENNIKKFYNNPWVNQKDLWITATGILQLFPANALNTSDGIAYDWDPNLNYDWRYALIFGLDFAYRLNSKYPEAQSWADIRRGWSSLKDLYNPNSSHSIEVLGRFLKGLEKTNGPKETVYIKPDFSKYKEMGFKATLDYLLGKYPA